MGLACLNLVLLFSSTLLIIECIPLNYNDQLEKDDFLLNNNSNKLVNIVLIFFILML